MSLSSSSKNPCIWERTLQQKGADWAYFLSGIRLRDCSTVGSGIRGTVFVLEYLLRRHNEDEKKLG